MLAGDRTVLSRAITLVESNAAAHFDLAQQVIAGVLPRTGRAVRVGITGVPGAGKSTFIEALGVDLCREGHRSGGRLSWWLRSAGTIEQR